jgi:hypothetical protein
MVVDVLSASAFQSGVPRPVFDLPLNLLVWDVSPDGRRFLMARPVEPLNSAPITVELNWQARLRD